MNRASIQSWNENYHGLMPVEIDGWHLTFFNDCDTLEYCEYCEECRPATQEPPSSTHARHVS
ncbi:DUF7693 family protein [Pseudomonas mandelii]|uniref:DUF7693 family protein n=1 Tax=Pseudomonas mandelii TaxID=75612 RepID=UPI003D2F94DF